MKKMFLALSLSVITLALQADEAKPSKDAKSSCTQSSACCKKSEKASCAKGAPKVETPKGAEQAAK